MGGMNLIVSVLLTAVTVAGASIAWPRLTRQPRPEPLEQVNSIVKDTPLGKSFANILGVSSQSAEPINVASEASKLTANIIKTAQERAAKIVVTQAVRGIFAQMGNLPPEDQAQIHDLLCTPSSPAP